MNALLALWQGSGQMGTWGVADWAIAIVIIAGIAAAVFLALRQLGVAIPAWVIQLFWILVVVFVVVAAIRLLASM
jgi:hypothetical protein